jgi:epoxide hydrolase 4
MKTKPEPSFHFHALPNGITLHAAHWGDPSKPLMLFMHGFPEFWFAWRNIAPAFASDYYCVAPDLRGFNLSSMPEGAGEYKAYKIAQDIYLLAQALHKTEAVLVSHDWGGAVAWSMAIAQTQKTTPPFMKALISINSPHPVTFQRELVQSPEQQTASAYMLWLRESFAAQALSKARFEKLKQFMLGMTSNKAWFTESVAQAYEACWAHGLEGGLNYYRVTPLVPASDAQHTARDWVPKLAELQVRVPTLVLWGEADTALLPQLLDGLEDMVQPLQVRRVKDASHWICHEQPKRVITEIQAFLTKAS